MLFSYSEIFNDSLFWSNTFPSSFFILILYPVVPIWITFLHISCFTFFWVPYFLPHSACLLFPPIDAFESPDIILSVYCNFFALHLSPIFFSVISILLSFHRNQYFFQSLRTWILTWALVEDMGLHLEV